MVTGGEKGGGGKVVRIRIRKRDSLTALYS
jgi:hypothetical protein